MIKAEDLKEFRPTVRYVDGENVTLQVVQDALAEHAEKLGIQVAFRKDKVKSGSLINRTIEDCIVMYHPQHERDYFNFCIRVRRQGVYAFVPVMYFGRSSQMAKVEAAEFSKNDRRGKSMSYKVGSLIGQGLISIGKSKQKLEEEKMYYQCVFDIFDDIVS